MRKIRKMRALFSVFMASFYKPNRKEATSGERQGERQGGSERIR